MRHFRLFAALSLGLPIFFGSHIAQAQDLPQIANATKFSQPKPIPTAFDDTPVDIEAVDVDNDGDIDLVWTSRGDNYGTDAIMWNENLGGGEFGIARPIDVNFNDPRALALGDLNGDGLVDVVAGSNGQDVVATFLNNGISESLSGIQIKDVAQGRYNTAILTELGDVFVFGLNGYDVENPPIFNAPVAEIVGHSQRSFSAKLEDGSVKQWGYDNCGVTDEWLNEMTDYRIPENYGIGLRPDSTLSHIGCNNYGIESVPTDSNFVGIWTGQLDEYWAGGIKADGSVVMWGRDRYGNQNVPENLGPVWKASGGFYWTLALMRDSTLQAWGYNGVGQLNNLPSGSNFVEVKTGYGHGLALKDDGELISWGTDGYGLQQVPAFDGPVVDFGTGFHSSWARTESGQVYLWGDNEYGKTGDALTFIDGLALGFVGGVSVDTSFASAGLVYEGTDVYGLALADFDGDGDLDVLSGGCDDQDVAWYENDGNGEFDGSRHLLAEDIQCVRSVLAVDIDLDGDPDAVTLTNSGQLSWFENIAQGNFGSQVLVADWGNGWAVQSADLNNDGNPDLIMKDYRGCFRWYANPGPVGDWTFQQEQCPPNVGYDTESAFALVDLIGDDGLDVVTSSYQYGNASIEISVNRDGYFDETYSAVNLPTGSAGLRGLTAADLDGDGDMDLVATDWDGDQVFWLAQEPSTAPTELRASIDPAATNVLGLAYADFDGDGDMDLVSADHGKDHVELYLNDGGGFVGPTTISYLDAYRVETADLNNDGHMDVLVAGGDSDRVEYIPGDGDGTFGEPVTVSDATNTVWGVSAADLDNDGDLDVVSASRDDDKFAWYKNLGDGNFGPQQILTILIDQPFDVATSDVDGDGDMDIVGITYEGGDRVVWFENQGGGLFSQYIQIADTDGGLYKLHMADVNGDGSEDALVANVERDRVSYYPNLGGGQWGSEVIVTSYADGCQAVFAADMDADGDLDIVSASEADDKVAWYENLGSDEFGMQQPFVIGRTQGYLNPATRCSDYRSVIAFDADGDGLTDVIAGAQQGGIDLFGNSHGATIGCADESACNYDASAEGTYGCQFDCYGCTIAEAINFSPESTIDDGSCLIPQTGCEEVSGNLTLCAENNVDTVITYCPSEEGIFLNLLIQSGQLEDLADYLTIYDGPDTTAATQMGEPLTGDLTGLEFGATNSEGCLTLHLQTDVSLSCADGFFNPIKYIVSCGYLEYQGCMDESACNYDPDAVIDDGSCTTLDCLGVCGGGAVQDDVCEVCVDVDALLDDDSTPELMEINGFFYELPASGEEVVDFEKPNGAPNQSQYWDQISPSVALYRGDNQGLFNPVTQGGWSNYIDGTLWGPANSQNLDLYSPNWQDQICNLFGNCQIGQVIQGKTMSLYIPETDEFYLVEFTSWSCCYQGGFAYTRTKVGSPFEVPNNFDNLQGQVNLVTDSVVFGVTNEIVQWSMPVGVEYDYIEIEATGAQGGGWIGSECGQENRGRGARITGIYPAGDFPSTLKVLVGAMGQSAHDLCRNTGGGGGGSFVVADGQPLVIAGGGGGNGDDCNAGQGADASIYQTANPGKYGGTGETGYQGSQCATQGAGGGFYNNTTFNSAIGQGFLDGGLGGFGNGQAPGGFGGGGAGQCGYGGGGGGYSGGGTACDDDFGGGGGSYNSGLYQENESGLGLGDGRVVIRLHRILGSNCAPGCMDSGACNFDPLAVEDDGSCEYQTCAGCVDLGACNFDETATISDADQCDYYTCLGCTDEEACNYDETATIDAEDCIYPTEDRDCDGNCYVDTDGDGVCDGEEVLGCTYPQASNYNPFATEENGSCVFSDVTDVFGCIYPTACNFNPAATADDGTCFYAEEGYDCSGVCLFDTDGDGICNQFEGCTNTLACNYDPQALDNDGTCVFPPLGYDCDGGCLFDSDGDGICDNFEFPGCTDVEACNYYDGATDDDGSCVYADYGYDCSGYCLGDEDNDGICDLNEIEGCTIETACNYDPEATENDGSCALPIEFYNCDGSCMNDDDGDGVCDELEVAGCTYMEADNFNADATDDDGSCTFYDLYGLEGCTDAEACNFNLLATDNDGSCIYAEAGYDCDGNCLEDEDGDGICNQDDPDFVGSAYCGPGTEWDSEAQMCVPAPTCIGDLNYDLEVNINDLLDLLSAFGTSCL